MNVYALGASRNIGYYAAVRLLGMPVLAAIAMQSRTDDVSSSQTKEQQ